MYCYAQLDINDICIGVCSLSNYVEDHNMIPIPIMDTDYLWRKYDRETQTWSEEKYEPQSTAPLTEFEELKQRNQQLEQAILELSMLIGGIA